MLTWNKYLVDIEPSSKYEKILMESKKLDNIDNVEEIEKIEKEYIDKIEKIKQLNNDDVKQLKERIMKLDKEEHELRKMMRYINEYSNLVDILGTEDGVVSDNVLNGLTSKFEKAQNKKIITFYIVVLLLLLYAHNYYTIFYIILFNL